MSGTVPSLACYLLVGLFSYFSVHPSVLFSGSAKAQDQPLVTQEIRYYLPEAGEVFLVWGINGWAVVPEGIRPARTVVEDSLMYTQMVPIGDAFVAKVQVPARATIDYAFQITQTRSGTPIEVWDTNGAPNLDYHTVAVPGGVTEVLANLTTAQELRLGKVADLPLVTQQIWYVLAEAGEVSLVWGINGWNLLPKGARPVGTVVKKTAMYTPMLRSRDTFVARVQVPPGTIIDYAFQITKTRSGTPIEVWDNNGAQKQNYHTVAVPGGIAEVQATVTLAQKAAGKELHSFLHHRIFLAIGIFAALSMALILVRIKRRRHQANREQSLDVFDVFRGDK